MARKPRHYAKSNFLWRNFAYCDQWGKVMAIYDEDNNLRAVVKKDDDTMHTYYVLLIGDDFMELYEFDNFELGSTGKNMDACFKIYCGLEYLKTPSYMPTFRGARRVNLEEIFPHTRVSARRTGGFHVTNEDLSAKIDSALDCYEDVIKELDPVDCIDYGYEDTIIGEGGFTMYHIGGGVYCDDDGDNWDFF